MNKTKPTKKTILIKQISKTSSKGRTETQCSSEQILAHPKTPVSHGEPFCLDLGRFYNLALQNIKKRNSKAKQKLTEALSRIKGSYHTREILQDTRIHSFSLKNRTLAVATQKPEISLFQVLSSSITNTEAEIKGHSTKVIRIILSTNARYMFSCSADKTIILWEFDPKMKKNGSNGFGIKQIVKDYCGVEEEDIDLLWSDRKRLLVFRAAQKVVIFALSKKNLLDVFQELEEDRSISRVFISKDGQCLLSETPSFLDMDAGGFFQERHFWGENDQKTQFLNSGMIGRVNSGVDLVSAHFYNNNSRLVLVENSGTVFVHSRTKDPFSPFFKVIELVVGEKETISCSDMSRRGKYLVIGTKKGQLLVYRHLSENGFQLAKMVKMHDSEITNVQITDSLAYVVTSSIDKTIKIRTIQSLIHYIKNAKNGVSEASGHSPEPKTGSKASESLSGGCMDQRVVCGPHEVISKIKVSKDGRLLVLIAQIEVEDLLVKKSIKFFLKCQKIQKYKKLKEFFTRSQIVAISSDRTFTLTAEGSSVLRYQFKAARGGSGDSVSFLDSFKARQGKVTVIRFLGGSERFLTGGANGSIKIWANEPKFKKVDVLQAIAAHKASIIKIQVPSSSGDSFYSASKTGNIKFFQKFEKFEQEKFGPLRSNSGLQTFYATQRKPTLILVANELSQILVFKKRWKSRQNRFILAQKASTTWGASRGRFVLKVFDNERYVMTMRGQGEKVRLWFLYDNGLIPLYILGKVYNLELSCTLNNGYFVENCARNVVRVFDLRAEAKFLPESFLEFKLVSSLFRCGNEVVEGLGDGEEGQDEGLIDKSRIESVIDFFLSKLSWKGRGLIQAQKPIRSRRGSYRRGKSRYGEFQDLNYSIKNGNISRTSIDQKIDLKPEDEVECGRLRVDLNSKSVNQLPRTSLQFKIPQNSKYDKSRRISENAILGQLKTIMRSPTGLGNLQVRKNHQKINKNAINSKIVKTHYSGLTRLQDDRTIHSILNPVLLGVLTKEPTLLTSLLTKFGHNPFYYQSPKKHPKSLDPFDTALKINNLGILDAIATHLSTPNNPYTNQALINNLFLSYLTIKRFKDIMKSSSELLKEKTMQRCFVEPQTSGSTKITELWPVSKRGFRVFKSSCLLFDQELKNEISRIAETKSKIYKNEPVRVKMFRFPFSSSLFAKSAKNLLEAALCMSDGMLTSDFKYLVVYIWNENFYVILGMTFYNIVAYLVFVVYIVWFQGFKWLGVVSVVTSSSLFFYEMVILSGNPSRLLSSFRSFLDLLQYSNRPIIAFLSLLGWLSHQESAENLWINFVLLVRGFRAFAELRIFDSIRTLIAMINQTMLDMTSFIVAIFAITLIFCILTINASKTSEHPMLRFTDLFKTLDYYYNLANGNWEPDLTRSFNMNELINFYFSGIILAVMMMNLLIAVISLTFDQFYQIKELVDLKERANLLYDHSEFFWRVQKLFGLNEGKEWDESKVNHCFLIRKEAKFSDEILGRFGELDDRIDQVCDEFEDVRDGIEEGQEELRGEVAEVRKELGEKLDSIKAMLEGLLGSKNKD